MRLKQLLLACMLMTFAAPALADAPNLLNYQGRLTDPSGNPSNGTFSMTFAFYDAESGGNQLPAGAPWSETQSVMVTNGVFNVLLGSVAALPTTLFQGGPSDSSGPVRYLQVTVDGEPLVPRNRIASVAYSLSGRSGSSSMVTDRTQVTSFSTEVVDRAFTTTFQPKVIMLYYQMAMSLIAGGSSQLKGRVIFDETTCQTGIADTGEPIPCNLEVTAGSCRLSLAVAAVTDTSFTIQSAYTESTQCSNGNTDFVAMAFN